MKIEKALMRVTKREQALARLNLARIDVSGDVEASALGHRVALIPFHSGLGCFATGSPVCNDFDFHDQLEVSCAQN